MSMVSRLLQGLSRLARRIVNELRWAMPGGPGRPHPWAELDDLEAMRRKEREQWRRDADG